MNPKKVVVGMPVVVSDEPDATIYTVKSFDGVGAELVYFSPIDNRECYGGQTHVSLIKVPSKVQLNYATVKCSR